MDVVGSQLFCGAMAEDENRGVAVRSMRDNCLSRHFYCRLCAMTGIVRM